MAAIDLPSFVADLKDHAADHGFHVHDERHFVESYSLRQTWEVDAHPEEGCEGPVDLYLSLEIDPRVLLGFVIVVGLYGGFTAKRSILVLQALPAAIALALTLV